jgi:hypothetical protein
MGQLAADRRRGEGPPPVRVAWAPVLADSGTDLHDVRVECGEPVWRETVRVRLACTAGKQSVKIERLQKENEWQEAEIERLQKENEWQEAGIESLQKDNVCLQEENERLQKENDVLRLVAYGEKATIVVKDLQDKELRAPLCCPISMQLFKDPVVSIYGHSFERRDIEEWLVEKQCCPMTRDPLTIADLTTNFALAGVADAFRFYEAPAPAPAEEEKPAE